MYVRMYVCMCFSLILDSSVGLSTGIQSPFDSNIACLCQSIEINNNKHVCMYVICIVYPYNSQDCFAGSGAIKPMIFTVPMQQLRRMYITIH